MSYCEKCDAESDIDDECMCPQFKRHMENGQTNRVPMAWKLDHWDGYPNAPEYCDHADYDEWMDGSGKCKLCGLEWNRCGVCFDEFAIRGSNVCQRCSDKIPL